MDSYPCKLIGLIDPKFLCLSIPSSIDVCGKFALRNIVSDEIWYLSKLREDFKPSPFRSLPPLTPDHCVLEVNAPEATASVATPTDDILESLFTSSSALLTRSLTLLRLSSSCPIGLTNMWMLSGGPWAQLLGVDHSDRILGCADDITIQFDLPQALEKLQQLVADFWDRDKSIEEENPVRWFNKSYAEIHLEDKLVDLIFALEQIYLRKESERSYLSYKLCLRGAFLLAQSSAFPDDRKQIFKNLHDGYKKRNKIVHDGISLTPDTQPLIKKLEDYLRISIPLYLKGKMLSRAKDSAKITDFWNDLILSAPKDTS